MNDASALNYEVSRARPILPRSGKTPYEYSNVTKFILRKYLFFGKVMNIFHGNFQVI